MADVKKCILVIIDNDALAGAWAEAISAACGKYDIINDERVAMFIAQVAHESNRFAATVENLNYSASALRSVFGKYFPTDALAAEYARQPSKIASRVYANRLGNGPEGSGEGWKYRGRGLIQLTGKNNVRKFSVAQFGDERLVEDPSPLEAKDLASMSAGWFWQMNGLNEIADRLDIEAATKKINGGLNGLDDRKEKWITIRAAMGLA